MDLATHAPKRGQIKETAERWGFTSGAHFDRSIRTYFGTSPGELFGAPISPPSHLPNFEYLDRYMTPMNGG
jgi:AraC-like DNA-binding protein